MDQVEGRSFIKSVLDSNSRIKLKPVATRANDILTSFDANNDGLISRDEFTEGYMNMHCTKNGRGEQGSFIFVNRSLVILYYCYYQFLSICYAYQDGTMLNKLFYSLA